MSEEESGELQGRRDKRDALRTKGLDPYPARFERRDRSEAFKAAFVDDGPEQLVQTAGRVRAIRGHGKTSFVTLEDETGTFQAYFKKETLAEAFDLLHLIDIGDFIGVSGAVFRTRMGEVTVHVATFAVLAKALEPLPSQWHGLADVEIRYRRRYLDLIANREVREVFKQRAFIIAGIRKFLSAEGFMEVETPMMQALAGGAAARPFITHHNTLDIDLYLRIAPELYLKRLIVGGFERVFELNRNFRNEGMDRNHNPEFTMLELYEAYADYERMMELTEQLIRTVGPEKFRDPFRRITYFDAIIAGGGPSLVPSEMTDGEELEGIFERYAEPMMVEPTFVTDFPTILSPLAKKRADDPSLVERFELYIDGMEIANAFSELNDPDDQEARFRAQGDVIDEDYVAALRVGMPPAGGLGIGIDRLVMILTGSRTIRDVILFPTMRPE